MLDPRSRQLLREALRPPTGYTLDQAVLTTFSLDLVALLVVPLSFTFFPVKDADGPPVVDPLALLEAIRRSADRITVFHQAGQIYVPAKAMLLLAHLEQTVVGTRARREHGVFHPKVTILRYIDEGGEVIYRVLVSSRNLTFDRSWDTLLTLEGSLKQNRSNAFARNRPLAKFVEALPGLAVADAPVASVDRCRQFANELLKVDFQTPDGFDEMEFFPLGLDGRAEAWPILSGRRTLAMSPFIDAGFVQNFEPQTLGVISRQAALDELPVESINGFFGSWHLNAAADPVREEAGAQFESVGTLEPSTIEQLHGLHAKLFIADDGWNTHIYTGSANATTAAFERNVEFLVRLGGKRSKWGIDTLLRSAEEDDNDKEKHFADLLVPYVRVEQVVDNVEKALEHLLDEVRYELAQTAMVARVEQVAELYRVLLTSVTSVQFPTGVNVRCHPLTLKPNNATTLAGPVGPNVAVFEALTFEAITSFFGFHLVARLNGVEKSCSFVINATLVDAPPDRASRLLTAMLQNREQLLRYLLLLLAADEAEAWEWAEILSAGSAVASATGGSQFGLPLLEPLMRSLDRNPNQLDSFNRVVEDLCKTSEGTQLIGERFLEIWRPIWATRKELTHD